MPPPPPPPPISRRTFLAGVAASGALVAAGCSSDGGSGTREAATTTTSLPVPDLPSDPFTLGVASGDPLADRVVLWTRLAPDPLGPRGGMPRLDVPVRWEVQTAEDREPVADGIAVAPVDHGHSVHQDVTGLDPATAYRYRFTVGDFATEWALTRTLPAGGDTPDDTFTIGQVSCAQYDGARYAAYRDLAEQEPDLVVFLGDYIYEHPGGDVRPGVITAITLSDYRYQYALYRTDPNLRRAHAVAPWIVIWDDHEVSNNYVSDVPDPDSESPSSAALLERRAAAYQAWWENMPVRLDPPQGPDLAIHRRFDVGDLATIHALDTRQYRTSLECGAGGLGAGRRCDASTAATTTVLGEEQEAWLDDGVRQSTIWHVLAQQIVFHQWRFADGDDAIWNLDQWDGYPVARERLNESLAGAQGWPVVLTGDVHSSWAADLRHDYDDPSSTALGIEVVAPGVGSDGTLLAAVEPVLRRNNPHIKFSEAGHRGWVLNTVTPDEWTAEFRLVDDHTDGDSAITTAATLVARPGGGFSQA